MLQTDILSIKKKITNFAVIVNLIILGFFKYYNFFIHSLNDLILTVGMDSSFNTLSIIVPIGISFYTFHSISYILDIYYNRITHSAGLIEYSLFISYFPLLVAGPIERATHLLPQFYKQRSFSYSLAINGLKLILLGFFKKVVLADSLSPLVDDIFLNFSNYSSLVVFLGVVGFAFQIYGDFSGYTDIARGISQLLGIKLLLNFNTPYLSKSIPEFWSRWHISLSSWLNDYVFKPLALSFRDYNKKGTFFAVLLTFLISGFWHGADWHYLAWGLYHGLLYLNVIFFGKHRFKGISINGSMSLKKIDFFNIILTFLLVCIGYVLFRSESLKDAFQMYIKILNLNLQGNSFLNTNTEFFTLMKAVIAAFLLILFELKLVRDSKYFYFVVLLIILFLGSFRNSIEFIYFQF